MSQVSNITAKRPPATRPGLMGNVLWSWAGHLVFIVAGFLLPRFMDRQVGQEMLGVWDFAWSLLGYLTLVQMGVGASINVYVAKYSAREDFDGLNRAVSSVMCLQLLTGVIIALLTVIAVFLMPLIWTNRLAGHVDEAQWLLCCLGLGASIALGLGCYDGVLTGLHRWDLHNLIGAGSRLLIVGGMLTALLAGKGLRSMGVVYLVCCALEVMGYWIAAHRICPRLRVRFSLYERTLAAEMFRFGGKTFVRTMANTLLYQTNSVFIASSLGPASLALYSRPLALVQHVRQFSAKFAHTLTPIASELNAASDRDGMARMAVKMARYNVAIALPPILFLAILGGPLVQFWMGEHYRRDLMVALLALGHLVSIGHQPLHTILIGVNGHGRPALATLILAALSVPFMLLVMGPLGWGLNGAAFALGTTLVLTDGVCLVWMFCRRLAIPAWPFVRGVWFWPVLHVLPLGVCLALARVLLPPTLAMIVGGGVGGAVTAAIYWRWVLPSEVKAKLLAKLPLGRFGRQKAAGLPGATAAPNGLS